MSPCCPVPPGSTAGTLSSKYCPGWGEKGKDGIEGGKGGGRKSRGEEEG